MKIHQWPYVRTRVPPELQKQIAREAAKNRRSINSETLVVLEKHYAEIKKTEEAQPGSTPSSVSQQ
ncbi:Arc family DNA-binding protein [Gluconobacter oxydans]|uniref:Arc family DNA-binding protein n=1 Tax=Gluconobacter oxydans TaxID=442 RepID=UPI000B122450|nr:Arc family DNA-binding protein [Gluconobacter oxydans]